MAIIEKLLVSGLRNIDELSLEPSAGINVIEGENGAGKTSILEAIHILATSRSFRTPKVQQAIAHESDHFTVSSVFSDGERSLSAGIEKKKDSFKAVLNRQKIQSISNITRVLPVLAMHPTSFMLLTGVPGLRRAFLDWGCFYFNSDFNQHWKKYNRILSQRNASLRMHSSVKNIIVWDEPLVKHALEIDRYRNNYLSELNKHVVAITKKIGLEHKLSLEYRSGWGKGEKLKQVVASQLERDMQAGFTWSGPHRGDLVVKMDQHKVNDVASRGQLKLIILILILSQAIHFTTDKKMPCILLLDDLPSEFDNNHLLKIIKLVKQLKSQAFITMIDSTTYPFIDEYLDQTFHVEHGSLSTKPG